MTGLPLDITFLNREGRRSVKSLAEVEKCFLGGTASSSPFSKLNQTLPKLVKEYKDLLADPKKKLLIFVAVDENSFPLGLASFDLTLKKLTCKNHNLYVTLVSCAGQSCQKEALFSEQLHLVAYRSTRVGLMYEFLVEKYLNMKNYLRRLDPATITKNDFFVKALLVALDPRLIRSLFIDPDADRDLNTVS